MIEISVYSLPQIAKMEWICYLTAYKRAKAWRYIQVNCVSNQKGNIVKKYIPPTELAKIYQALILISKPQDNYVKADREDS